MNESLAAPRRWSSKKWLAVILLLGTLHWLLLVQFSSQTEPAPRRMTGPPPLRLAAGAKEEAALARQLESEDPTLFSVVHYHGFSRSWLRAPVPAYPRIDWTAPPVWLAQPTPRLGRPFAQYTKESINALAPSLRMAPPRLFGLTVAPAPVLTASRLEIRGPLATLLSHSHFRLPVWAHTELLSNSVVELLAAGNGDVVSVRLLGRSGYPRADAWALDFARQLHIPRPPGPVTAGPSSWGALTRNTLVFHWVTSQPLPTRPHHKAP